MDVNRALRSAAQTGEVLLGIKETMKAVEDRKAKLIVVASNALPSDVEKVESLASKNQVPVYKYTGSNNELGPACGKPFSVAVLSVLEAGESEVLHLARGSGS